MVEVKSKRAAKAAKELNVGLSTLVQHLQKKGYEIEEKPTSKLTEEMYKVLLKDFREDLYYKEEAAQVEFSNTRKEDVGIEDTSEKKKSQEESGGDEVIVSSPGKAAGEEEDKTEHKEKQEESKESKGEVEEETPTKDEKTTTKEDEDTTTEQENKSVKGPKVVGKVDLQEGKKKKEKQEEKTEDKEEVTAQQAEESADQPEADTEEKPTEDTEEAPAQVRKSRKLDDDEETKVTRETKKEKLSGPRVVGKVDLPPPEERKKQEEDKEEGKKEGGESTDKKKRKRRRITKKKEKIDLKKGDKKEKEKDKEKEKKSAKKKTAKNKEEEEVSEKEIQEKIKNTMAKIGTGTGKGKKRAKYKRQKKEEEAERAAQEAAEQANKLQLTEFISVNELASLMEVSPTDVINTCMNLGVIVTINQRLDAEVIELVTDEYGYEVEFISASDQEVEIEEEEDDPNDLVPRAPIVTVMGHVDHGKTSLLDYIREDKVVAGEKGGITQHIGAYEVTTEKGNNVTFLDTPGHEAFTAMRARGAKITDVAVIVIAADDQIMPQTEEAINHAQAAGVPMIFAINKVDKEDAAPDRVKEQLANMNLLVEEWGGKYQCEEISAKNGNNIDELLEKIILESELLELKANPNKKASGTVVEATLDKGRGYVATVLVQEGTLKVGDNLVAGPYYGRVKAMFNERNQNVYEAGLSQPVLILGLNGAPQSGVYVKVLDSEHEAKEIATKRMQLTREQQMRAKKHITLDEIGRRLALGTFKELNIIVKADYDGSVEALADSLLKLSREEIQVNVIHKGVGQITESDVLLASASDAIIIGFQVRPSAGARKVAERENIEIRLYSVIYDAIEEVKTAMEGMLEPKIEEKVVGNAEVRETFKVKKIGTVAGCYVTNGKITRNSHIRVIRDGIVQFTGELASLKRFKEDVKEVKNGYECGLNVKNYNDIQVGDELEAFEEVEVKREL